MKAEVAIEMLRYFLSTSMGRNGMTRAELADRTGISMKAINNYFRGESELPENDLYKIMNAIFEKDSSDYNALNHKFSVLWERMRKISTMAFEIFEELELKKGHE